MEGQMDRSMIIQTKLVGICCLLCIYFNFLICFNIFIIKCSQQQEKCSHRLYPYIIVNSFRCLPPSPFVSKHTEYGILYTQLTHKAQKTNIQPGNRSSLSYQKWN